MADLIAIAEDARKEGDAIVSTRFNGDQADFLLGTTGETTGNWGAVDYLALSWALAMASTKAGVSRIVDLARRAQDWDVAQAGVAKLNDPGLPGSRACARSSRNQG